MSEKVIMKSSENGPSLDLGVLGETWIHTRRVLPTRQIQLFF